MDQQEDNSDDEERALMPPETNLPPAINQRIEEESNDTQKIPLITTVDAARSGNIMELERLFAFPDEDPFRTIDGLTPLHIAVNYGNPRISHAMSEVILNRKYFENQKDQGNVMRRKLIDTQNTEKETALHIAAKNGHRKTVEFLLKKAANVNIKSDEHKKAIEMVYKYVPNAMITIFDSSITNNGLELHEDKFEVNFKFGPILGVPGSNIQKEFMETKLLKNALVESPLKYEDILTHPLVQIFLYYKWNKIRYLLWASIFSHIFWLLAYSFFVADLLIWKCPYILTATSTVESDAFNGTAALNPGKISCPIGIFHVILACFLVFVAALVSLKEIYEFYTAPSWKYYFFHPENLLQILVIIFSFIAGLWVLIAGTNSSFPDWYYQIAAFGVFISGTLILLQIGKVPECGIYVQVLVKVIKSFGFFIATFISLLMGFAVSFSILMPQNEKFTSIPFGIFKMLVMMTGELQYDEIFYNEDTDGSLLFPISAQLFFAAFVIMVTIILFNLLIGFTVSDIQGLKDTATVFRISRQLEQIHVMESFLFSSVFRLVLRCFNYNPETFLRKFMVTWYQIKADSLPGFSEPSAHESFEMTSEISTRSMKKFFTGETCFNLTNPPTEPSPLTFPSGPSNENEDDVSGNHVEKSPPASISTNSRSSSPFRLEITSSLPKFPSSSTDSCTGPSPWKFSTTVTRTKNQIPKELWPKVLDLVLRNFEISSKQEEISNHRAQPDVESISTDSKLKKLILEALREYNN